MALCSDLEVLISLNCSLEQIVHEAFASDILLRSHLENTKNSFHVFLLKPLLTNSATGKTECMKAVKALL